MWDPGDLEFVRLPQFLPVEAHFSARHGRDELVHRYDLALKLLDDNDDVFAVAATFGFDADDMACLATNWNIGAMKTGAVHALRTARAAALPIALLLVVRDITYTDVAHAILPDAVVITVTVPHSR